MLPFLPCWERGTRKGETKECPGETAEERKLQGEETAYGAASEPHKGGMGRELRSHESWTSSAVRVEGQPPTKELTW